MELDRRRLDRQRRGQKDEDQQHRHDHEQAAPERDLGDRSERAVRMVGRLHARVTPDPAFVFHSQR